MKIAESAIQLYSERTSIEHHQKQESLTIWSAGDEEGSTVRADNGQGQEINVKDHITALSNSTEVQLSQQAMRSRSISTVEATVSKEDELMLDLNIRILKAMIERFTGKKIDLVSSEELRSSEEIPQGVTNEETVVEEVPEGGLIYDYYESHYESESTNFAATGKILTEDGQEIDFAVELNMSREFFNEERINIQLGDALKDPLVVNFSGSAAQLSQNKFSFDIDNDGVENQISFLKPGSGFLALDKNNDNIINNGTELFGPKSGNGFKDLAAYDTDGNNWIDENDQIFDKLRIWSRDSDGNNLLFALGEKGIGAIYLNSATTLFSMKNLSNELLGKVQSTGVFIGEDGGVGTVQQIDLVS